MHTLFKVRTKLKILLSETFCNISTTNYYNHVYVGTTVPNQNGIQSAYTHCTYEHAIPLPPYTFPYHPSIPTPSTQASVPHPSFHPAVPANVSAALSRVEHDLRNLNNAISHPHTINHPTCYNRARDLTNQVHNLTSIASDLKRKMASYKNSPVRTGNQFNVSPILRQPSNSPNNGRFQSSVISPPAVKRYSSVPNPYLKKKNNLSVKFPKVKSNSANFGKNDSNDFFDPMPSTDLHYDLSARMFEK